MIERRAIYNNLFDEIDIILLMQGIKSNFQTIKTNDVKILTQKILPPRVGLNYIFVFSFLWKYDNVIWIFTGAIFKSLVIPIHYLSGWTVQIVYLAFDVCDRNEKTPDST